MTLPPIPIDRNWSPETWRAGLDEAVRLNLGTTYENWTDFHGAYFMDQTSFGSTIAHATTLIDAGIVKPVVSDAAMVWAATYDIFQMPGEAEKVRTGDISKDDAAAIAVIQSALDKARAGE